MDIDRSLWTLIQAILAENGGSEPIDPVDRNLVNAVLQSPNPDNINPDLVNETAGIPIRAFLQVDVTDQWNGMHQHLWIRIQEMTKITIAEPTWWGPDTQLATIAILIHKNS
jgi:hypothetical protein